MTTHPVFTAHDVADLFNLLPATFGFMPEESLCAIATSGPRRRFGFRMRVDLPADADHVPQVARFVAGHLRNNGGDGAIVLVVSQRVDVAGRAAAAVERNLGPVAPVMVAWTDTRRYWTTDPLDPAEGMPLELSAHHPAVVSAVLAGQEVLPDRAALEARWSPLDDEASVWLAAQVPGVEQVLVHESCSEPRRAVALRGVAEVLEVVRAGADVDATRLLRAVVWLSLGDVRERLWGHYDRADAATAVVGWRELARRAPRRYSAVPYTIAAYLAYLTGDGAQAAIGLERARAADPCFVMARLLEEALLGGLHPDRVQAVVAGAGVG